MVMNGMIFAAGLGTRLAPLTASMPKALVRVANRPLLEWAIEHFVAAGVNNIVVNVHHKADQVEEFLYKNQGRWHADIAISDERAELLDTGGGLIKALSLFGNDGPIVVGNADVLSDAPLEALCIKHKSSGADATLLTSGRHSTRNLLFDAEGRLCGWRDVAHDKERMARSVDVAYAEAFNGFHVIEQKLIMSMGTVRPLPIIGAYLDAAPNFNIMRHNDPTNYYWFDVGTLEKLQHAQAFMENQQ